jgi:O-antigen/teichoic acid export membrane protein
VTVTPTDTADPNLAVSPDAAGAGGADSRSDLGMLARGGMLNMVGAASAGILTFALVIVLTRGLGGAGYGAFVSAMGLFTILSRTAELGADTGLVRTVARYRALGRQSDIRPTLYIALVPVLAVSTLFGVALYLWAPQLAHIFGKGAGSGRIADYARIFAPVLPFSAAYTVVLSGTRGFNTMIPSVLVDKVGRPGLQPLLALAAIAAGLGTTAIAIAWAGPIALAFFCSLAWLWSLLQRAERQAGRAAAREDRVPDPPRPRRLLAERFWRFTAPRGFAGIFQVVVLWLNTLLLGSLDSTRAAGVFNAATRYITAGLMVGVAVQQVAGPKLSELLAQRSHARAQTVYQTTTAWLMVTTWPLYLTMAIWAPALLRIFGHGFGAGRGALLVLGLTMLAATAVGTVDVVLLMGGRSSWNLYNTVAGLSLNLVLNLVLIPHLGITGAAIAWSSSILITNLAPLAQVWHFMGLHPFGRGFPKAAMAAGICYGALGLAVRLTLGTSFPVFIAYLVVAGIGYLAFLWRFRQDLELPVLWEELRKGRRPRRPATADPA